jgi:hypothetical protein
MLKYAKWTVERLFIVYSHLLKLFGAGHAVCRRHFLCREIWIPLSVILFYSVLPCQEFALENASRTGADDFDAKHCSRMNTCSACDYTLLASAKLLRSWRQQEPSNQSDIYLSVRRTVGRRAASDFICPLLHDRSLGWVLNRTCMPSRYNDKPRAGRRGVRFPAGVRHFSLLYSLPQTGSGAHSASCPMGTASIFPGSKEARAWSWPFHLYLIQLPGIRGVISPLPHKFLWRCA